MGLDGIHNAGGNRNIKLPLSSLQQTSNTTKTDSIKQTPLFGFKDINTIGRKELGNINPYGAVSQATIENKEIAQTTNDILKDLGYGNYKVSGAQVASVSGGVKNTVLPGMQSAENGAVAANLTSVPEGDIYGEEFSKLFSVG